MDKKHDFNSSVNQEVKGKFIGREVFCCVSQMMTDLLEKDEDMKLREDIENLSGYECPNCGDMTNEADDYKQDDIKSENDLDYICPSCNHVLDDEPEYNDAEVFEWWAVSNFLYEKLKEKGYVVLEYGTMYVWGRCTSGQAILLDLVISEICTEMEILEGQANDWSTPTYQEQFYALKREIIEYIQETAEIVDGVHGRNTEQMIKDNAIPELWYKVTGKVKSEVPA